MIDDQRTYVAFMHADYAAIAESGPRAVAGARDEKQPTIADAMLAIAEIKAGKPVRKPFTPPAPPDSTPVAKAMYGAGERAM